MSIFSVVLRERIERDRQFDDVAERGCGEFVETLNVARRTRGPVERDLFELRMAFLERKERGQPDDRIAERHAHAVDHMELAMRGVVGRERREVGIENALGRRKREKAGGRRVRHFEIVGRYDLALGRQERTRVGQRGDFVERIGRRTQDRNGLHRAFPGARLVLPPSTCVRAHQASCC